MNLSLSETEEQSRVAASDLVRDSHANAIKRQNMYHLVMATAVSALLVAFIGVAAELTFSGGFRPQTQFVALLDVTCLLVTLICFFVGIAASRNWMAARVHAELLRQWYVVDEILLGGASSGDLTRRFEKFEGRIKYLSGHVSTSISGEVLKFWAARHNEILTIVSERDLLSRRVGAYLQRRPVRQANWFFAARKRFEHQSHVRANLLAWLFGATLVLAVTRLGLVFHLLPNSWSVSEPFLTFFALCFIGLSSAMTALYVGQNIRSLVHRYEAQERWIMKWLETCSSQFDGGAGKMGELISGDEKMRLADSVLDFERLMIDELIDWIHISTHDVLELAPA